MTKVREIRTRDSNLNSRSGAWDVNCNVNHCKVSIVMDDGKEKVIFVGDLWNPYDYLRKCKAQGRGILK